MEGRIKKEVTDGQYKQWCVTTPDDKARRWLIDKVFPSETDAIKYGDKLIMKGKVHCILSIDAMLEYGVDVAVRDNAKRLKRMKELRRKYNG